MLFVRLCYVAQCVICGCFLSVYSLDTKPKYQNKKFAKRFIKPLPNYGQGTHANKVEADNNIKTVKDEVEKSNAAAVECKNAADPNETQENVEQRNLIQTNDKIGEGIDLYKLTQDIQKVIGKIEANQDKGEEKQRAETSSDDLDNLLPDLGSQEFQIVGQDEEKPSKSNVSPIKIYPNKTYTTVSAEKPLNTVAERKDEDMLKSSSNSQKTDQKTEKLNNKTEKPVNKENKKHKEQYLITLKKKPKNESKSHTKTALDTSDNKNKDLKRHHEAANIEKSKKFKEDHKGKLKDPRKGLFRFYLSQFNHKQFYCF